MLGESNELDFQQEDEGTVQSDALRPDLLESEITAAIKELKNNKAEGISEIPGELLNILGKEGMKVLIDLCRNVYVTGIWPSGFAKAVMRSL